MSKREIQIPSGTIQQTITRIKKYCVAKRLIVTTAQELDATVAAARESPPVERPDSEHSEHHRPSETL